MRMLEYAKALAGLVGSAGAAALGILPPDQYKWLAVVVAVATAVSVYAIPNYAPSSGRHVAK